MTPIARCGSLEVLRDGRDDIICVRDFSRPEIYREFVVLERAMEYYHSLPRLSVAGGNAT